MKKLDKSTILSKDYQKWLEELGDIHPPYNSSNSNYFNVKMSLLHCQNGLCAYTEQMLCDTKLIASDNWDDKKYIKLLTPNEKASIQGDLEHFDESLKSDKGWLWDNLFIVQTHANCRIKGTKSINVILKPDSPSYDENKYLQFDFTSGVFTPHNDLTSTEKQEVQKMIETLGINCIYSQRKKRLEEWKDRRDVGLLVEPNEYVTAWNMTQQQLSEY
ncbi:MAG: hypothetical protein WCW84_13645 [Sulfurimonas sp.]|jgi:hypothetical protein